MDQDIELLTNPPNFDIYWPDSWEEQDLEPKPSPDDEPEHPSMSSPFILPEPTAVPPGHSPLYLPDEEELAELVVSGRVTGRVTVTYLASPPRESNLHQLVYALPIRNARAPKMAPAPTATSPKPKDATATKHVKAKKKKVLLMGKSGSGKSSMRSIIFSNYVAKDVRRLAATIEVEQSRVKFLGNLVLNLWDCGGQDAFTDTYLNAQRQQIFSDVGVLIYVFDVGSRELERDLTTYNAIIKALQEFSPRATVFCLVHKMDLARVEFRDRIHQETAAAIREKSEGFEQSMKTYATSIWDQSLYKAWGNIVHSLIPNLEHLENYLKNLANVIDAEEIVLFERTTFLTVTSYTSEAGAQNPYNDRLERLSNIIKTFRHSLAKNTSSSTSSHQFKDFTVKSPRFNIAIYHFTTNTYVLLVFPPGEAAANCTRLNVQVARDSFAALELDAKGKDRGDSISNAGTHPVPDEEESTITGANGSDGGVLGGEGNGAAASSMST
ncbi:MAG: GTP-binding gtr1 [Lasallia pustulata]|uniref:GTP-binding protein n=1 Tax=Lasallia pustulata TaxID=136370 RepID=A0A1W5D4B4_9LECA|nr:MAG: GTP-binding gtr1 [Lasallia pustulata]SLM37905.1 small monomeric gtpase [Lasallia pustulata]